MGCAASSPAAPTPAAATLVNADAQAKSATEAVVEAVEVIPDVPLCDPYCGESMAVITLLWRPTWPDEPGVMERVCDRQKYVVYHPENMIMANDPAPAEGWLSSDDFKAICDALVSYGRDTVKCSKANIDEVNKSLSFNIAKGVEVKEAFGGSFEWTETPMRVHRHYSPPAGPQPEAKLACIETMARATVLDSMSQMAAENGLIKAKKALRKAFPCGRIDLQELWKTTTVDGDKFSGNRTWTETWKTEAPLYRGQKGGLPKGDFVKWAGVRCVVRPGTAMTHDKIVATCTKETPDAKFGIALDGLSHVPEPKVPPGFLKPVASEAKPKMPTIVTPGPVLEKSGLVAGDELLWINDVECTGSIKQCIEALQKAKAGDLRIVARRKKVSPV